eukprot:gene801-177_t
MSNLLSLDQIPEKEEKPTLSWDNVVYTVTDARGNKRPILKGVSGHLRRGRLTAIIGPSGAGKTSLLNLLSGRSGPCRGKTCDGNVCLRGQPIIPQKERDSFSYVMQEDHLWPTSTPREAIRFAAKLRSVPVGKREERIEEVIAELGLERCADSIIGGVQVKGISGGEKKSVAIGIEIVAHPAVLFLDEPTSGLDSYSAKLCVEIMREIAKGGKNVLTTIHQPSSEIFHLFDDVIFMCSGRVMYQGPLRQIKGHFAALKQPCPDGYNIADHVMETMQTLPAEQIIWMQDQFAEHGIMGRTTAVDNIALVPDAEGVTNEDDDECLPLMPKPLAAYGRTPSFEVMYPEVDYTPVPKKSIFFQCGPLLLREWRGLYRDRNALFITVLVAFLLYFTLGFIFWQRGDWESNNYDPKSHFGAIMMASVGFMFSNINPVMLAFPSQRPVFMREYAAGLYSTVPYVTARFIVDCCTTGVISCFAWVLCYWCMGMNGNFFWFWWVMFLLGMAASSMGLVLGSCVSTGRKALLLSPLILVPNILFAGFYLPISQIVVAIRWIQYICFLGYAVKLFVIDEFDWTGDVKTKVLEIVDDINTDSTSETTKELIANLKQSTNPIEAADADPDSWWVYMVVLLGIIFGFRLLTAVILAYKGRQSVQFFSYGSNGNGSDIAARAKQLFKPHPTEDPRALTRRKFRRLAGVSPLSKAAPEEEEVDDDIIQAWVELYQNASDQLAYDNTASPIGVTHVEHRDPQASDEVLLDEMSRPITFDDNDNSDDKKVPKK